MKRVVITGYGTISSSGKNSEELWENMTQGKSGIQALTDSNFDDSPTKLGGVIKEYDIDAYLDKKESKKTDRFTHFAAISSLQALEQAQFKEADFDLNRCGVFIGTGIGGINSLIENQHILDAKGSRRVSPLVVPKMIANMAAGFVSIKTGFKGATMCPISACATGNQAIGEAFLNIKYGLSDAILAGGTEASITPLAYAGFSNMKAMSTNNEQPEQASRPFDKKRDGFVMSEGAGVLFLEEFEHAMKRGATILGEIVGYGMTSDAYHMTAPSSEGAIRAMRLALEMAQLAPNEVNYLNAHATSTGVGDIGETKAIKAVFGEYAKELPISATKSMTGHLLGAAGGIESIICLKALENNILPPTINLDEPDEECDLFYIPNEKIAKNTSIVMSNGFGFGGHNATLVMRKVK
ncbi:beta-ketoacyl-ACP synthase II [Enterococcus saccharolyticus]|uniref:3-oxoacyl-[acyl-carrier-protein] synthase 2 n=1 Tax=Enterococcus saccharolyticus subsp. saccharolyticus ATCC 43076 TaxID=1139996 RepID=S0JAB8_9ENTE|nr:beta-ketoacyl-ACP synthase II [Enterococcus saccharolyticus]EOT29252.1 beta-ketoacyl-acyl-carrier-protein synthase II [Enterococcus saccharolyticus subsp. saccharolyticus ATCC 43076]EOT81050.1 beta-ketoacyl-acyl-carrier-protein synthase II [Enterococcus saccharolyticus subsp. saccharolyticus ATCC 43076]